MISNESSRPFGHQTQEPLGFPVKKANQSQGMGEVIHQAITHSVVPPVSEPYYVRMITLFQGNVPLGHALVEHFKVSQTPTSEDFSHIHLSTPTQTPRSATPSSGLESRSLSRESSGRSDFDAEQEDVNMLPREMEDEPMTENPMIDTDD